MIYKLKLFLKNYLFCLYVLRYHHTISFKKSVTVNQTLRGTLLPLFYLLSNYRSLLSFRLFRDQYKRFASSSFLLSFAFYFSAFSFAFAFLLSCFSSAFLRAPSIFPSNSFFSSFYIASTLVSPRSLMFLLRHIDPL